MKKSKKATKEDCYLSVFHLHRNEIKKSPGFGAENSDVGLIIGQIGICCSVVVKRSKSL